MRASDAVVIIAGDDVYEDLFGAGAALQQILLEAGLVCELRMGSGALDDIDESDLVVLYTAVGEFGQDRQGRLADAVHAGAGLLAIHASNVFSDQAGFRILRDLIGSRYVSHGPVPHESRFVVETDAAHPLTARVDAFSVTHEHYRLEVDEAVDVAAWRLDGDHREPLLHTREFGSGRSCYVQLGHDMRVWDDPDVRQLVTNAVRWAAPALRTVPSRQRSRSACL
jgi:type 1 glutamine amidotransferase